MADEKSTRRGFLKKLGLTAVIAGSAPVFVYENSEARVTRKKASKKKAAKKKAAKKKAAKKKATKKKATR